MVVAPWQTKFFIFLMKVVSQNDKGSLQIRRFRGCFNQWCCFEHQTAARQRRKQAYCWCVTDLNLVSGDGLVAVQSSQLELAVGLCRCQTLGDDPNRL